MALFPATLIETEKSKSNPKKAPYTFGVSDTGELVCNCPGWGTWKKIKPRECKHTTKLIAKHNLSVVKSADGQFWEISLTTPLAQVIQNQQKPVPMVEEPLDVVPVRSRFRTFTMAEDRNVLAEPIAPPIDVANIPSPYIEPMLASHPEVDLGTFSASDWVMEEKYDGHRVVVSVTNGIVKAWSRPRAGEDAKTRNLPPHVSLAFMSFPNGTYDGELLVPGGTSSDVVKLDNQSKLVFVVFDIMVLLGVETLNNTYVERRALLKEIFANRITDVVFLSLVMEPNPDVIEQMWADGKEGVILKSRYGKYRPGARSKDIIKVKKENSVPTTIIRFLPGKMGPTSVIQVRDDIGNITTVKVKDAKMMAEIAKNPDLLIGERLRIKFQDFTPTGGYRHPRVDRWENR